MFRHIGNKIDHYVKIITLQSFLSFFKITDIGNDSFHSQYIPDSGTQASV